jgi:hypothetical protein
MLVETGERTNQLLDNIDQTITNLIPPSMAKGIYYLEAAQKAIDKVNTFVSPLTKLINMGLVMQFRRVIRGTAVATIDSTPDIGSKGGKGCKGFGKVGIGGSRAVGAAGGLLAGMAMGAAAASLVNDYIV